MYFVYGNVSVNNDLYLILKFNVYFNEIHCNYYFYKNIDMYIYAFFKLVLYYAFVLFFKDLY